MTATTLEVKDSKIQTCFLLLSAKLKKTDE